MIATLSWQNIVYCKDRTENKACRRQLFHCMLRPFCGLRFYRSIHIIANRGYNHNNPAGQTRRKILVWMHAVRFRTSRWRCGSFGVPENICQFHSIIPLLEDQSSCCAKGLSARPLPVQAGSSKQRRSNMPLFYFRSMRLAGEETVPIRKRLFDTAYDNTVPLHSNIAAVGPGFFLRRSVSDIFLNSGQDHRRLFFCD